MYNIDTQGKNLGLTGLLYYYTLSGKYMFSGVEYMTHSVRMKTKAINVNFSFMLIKAICRFCH